jgi:hypothetical protein
MAYPVTGTGEFTGASHVAVTVQPPATGIRLIVAVLVTVPALAVMVAELTTAGKVVVVAPAATVTEEGTETEVDPLERVTTNPPVGAAALKVTVQVAVPPAETTPQVRLLRVSVGVADAAV